MRQFAFNSIILVALVFSCNQNNSDSSETNKEPQIDSLESVEVLKLNSEFESYLEEIEFLELPYFSKCGTNYSDYPSVDKKLKEKYTGKFTDPYRRIPTDFPIEIVMELAPADYLLPIIKTFSKNAKPIKTLNTFSGYCGGEPGWYSIEYFTIMENLRMIHIDSLWEYEVDSLYNKIDGTLKGTVKTSYFQILETGNISVTDSTTSFFN